MQVFPTTARRVALALALAGALAAAGCGGDDNEGDGNGAAAPATQTQATTAEEQTQTESGGRTVEAKNGRIALSADERELAYDADVLVADAGRVTIEFTNPSTIPHDVVIEGNGVNERTEVITDGKDSVTAELKPGTYTFYCSVAGHRAAGMEGTLTVK
jgi:plastocyanin